jgi:hypothetical protein
MGGATKTPSQNERKNMAKTTKKTTTKTKTVSKPEPKAKESSPTRPTFIPDRLLTAEGWKRLMMADAKKGKK